MVTNNANAHEVVKISWKMYSKIYNFTYLYFTHLQTLCYTANRTAGIYRHLSFILLIRPTYYIIIIIIIIIIIFLHGLGRSTCSGIDALPSFPGASTISSSSRFVIEGVFRKSGVVHSFEIVDPVLFVFGSHVLYSRDL